MNQKVFRNESAVVLMSGGQDSTTCLIWAKKHFAKVYAIGFFYNQKHAVELEVAKHICVTQEIPFKIVDIGFIQDIVTSNLFKDTADVNQDHTNQKLLPASFVPYRNQLFLTIAAGWADTLDSRNLVIGVSQTDYSGYPDCRDVFVKSCQVTLNLANDLKPSLVIHTPLMWLTKADEFELAEELGCLDLIIRSTMTCYNGEEIMREYGKGCDNCSACELRRKGYEEYQKRVNSR